MKLWMEHGEERKAKGLCESSSHSFVGRKSELTPRIAIFPSFDIRMDVGRDEQGELARSGP